MKCFDDDNPVPKDTLDKKEQYDNMAHDPQQFFEQLNQEKQDKFNVIGEYFGRQLFKCKKVEVNIDDF